MVLEMAPDQYMHRDSILLAHQFSRLFRVDFCDQ